MRRRGSTERPARDPELSEKRRLSKRRMWMWRRRERAKSRFFFTPRKAGTSVKHRRRPVPRSSGSSSSSSSHDVNVRLGTRGEAGGDGNVSEHPPDREKGPTSGVVDTGELQGGCGEAPAPASDATERPRTPGGGGGGGGSTGGLQTPRKRSGVGCTGDGNMVNGFKRRAVHQEPRRDRVCPQEVRTPRGAELVTEGKTGGGTGLGPVHQSLPGLGVSSGGQPQHSVPPRKTLSSTIKGTLL